MHIRWVRYPIACTVESTGPSNTAEMAADREDRRSRAAEASRAEQEREIRFMGHPLEEGGYRLMGRAGQADRVWQKGLPAQVQPGWPGVRPWLGLRATFPLGKTHRAA